MFVGLFYEMLLNGRHYYLWSLTLLSDTKFTFDSPVSISFSKLDNSQFVRNCVALTFGSGKFHCYFEFLIACDYSKTERSWCLSRQLFFNTLLNLFMNRNWKCFIGRWFGKVSVQPHTIVKQIQLFLLLFPVFKNAQWRTGLCGNFTDYLTQAIKDQLLSFCYFL